ncbi:GNAT family N-acetyltransferase [Methylobacter sp. YRD-M1]|uniref:GNAT family N-acetyltransferase n=1 Tax=Methylobacter sp. YRD-M1 TaxID=2911520 RepID=UPI00227A09AD|nr:GNAT family N-acetyltransferase [Methylobacter sp. YRD-M1]WAK02113.1 GNAT family N-acetyltransferase [Methylobacter sp. YRD-M1]
MSIEIKPAAPEQSPEIAEMVGRLLAEIMNRIDVKAFNFDWHQTNERLRQFLADQKYFVFVAEDAGKRVGFITLYEGYALYAEGAFGTIAELYVRPEYRSKGVGKKLTDKAKEFAAAKGWTRLEVTTPPLPQFERTLEFYEKEGFTITGGRKLKIGL